MRILRSLDFVQLQTFPVSLDSITSAVADILFRFYLLLIIFCHCLIRGWIFFII